ncbi:hypothetical protein [Deinococcus hopiensis]|uniref:Uncharacterized protein n=1 Tax=Deinococcus hopiensis KR-140 TaxID=695939 RepID=A0A1W1VJR5_9DEIO|nr:hypothetical protein [Deinococcus hopiensis]SMB93602.1 hypothetical protein SAMN00790413_02048 [Deinococcus hopiensis KR-140]
MTRAVRGTFAPRHRRAEGVDTPGNLTPIAPRHLGAVMAGVLALTLLGGVLAQLL